MLIIGSNLSNSYSYTPFEHCQNSKFIFRCWLENPLEGEKCNPPQWISINESLQSFEINTKIVNFVGVYKVYFQVQLIAHSLDLTNNDFYSSLNSSVFEFYNENAKFIYPNENLYLVLGISKTIKLYF